VETAVVAVVEEEEPDVPAVPTVPDVPTVPATTILNNTVRNEMDLMNKKIDSLIRRLESQPAPQDFFNKNIHDIILFIIFGLFLILVLDGMYKILLLKLNRMIN
jgi:hypothetical protein